MILLRVYVEGDGIAPDPQKYLCKLENVLFLAKLPSMRAAPFTTNPSNAQAVCRIVIIHKPNKKQTFKAK
jgi:hypothetical protein